MHEWAVAESVVKTLQNNNILQPKKIRILLGELQNIDEEVFIFALNEIMNQTNYKFNFTIEKVYVEFKCNSCGMDFNLDSVKNIDDKEKENIHFIPEMVKSFINCPSCGGIDFEIIKGRGVSVVLEE